VCHQHRFTMYKQLKKAEAGLSFWSAHCSIPFQWREESQGGWD